MKSKAIQEDSTVITLDNFLTVEQIAENLPLLHVLYPRFDWDWRLAEVIGENEYEAWIEAENPRKPLDFIGVRAL